MKIDPSDSLENKVSGLLKLSFKDSIMNVKAVYKFEDHIAPQTLNFSRGVFGLDRVMRMNRYIHLENPDEMKWLADYFKLDLSIRVNATSGISDEVEWDAESIAIVKEVFRKDFEIFGYELEP